MFGILCFNNSDLPLDICNDNDMPYSVREHYTNNSNCAIAAADDSIENINKPARVKFNFEKFIYFLGIKTISPGRRHRILVDPSQPRDDSNRCRFMPARRRQGQSNCKVLKIALAHLFSIFRHEPMAGQKIVTSRASPGR